MVSLDAGLSYISVDLINNDKRKIARYSELTSGRTYFSSNEITSVFKHKHRIDLLSNDGQTREIVVQENRIDLSETIQQINSLISCVKEFLKNRPEGRVFKLAAKTTLLQSHIITATFELSREIIAPNSGLDNQQDVFLFPDSGIVIKSMSDRYLEEEDTLNQLFTIFGLSSVIPAYRKVKGLSTKRLCEELDITNPNADTERPSEYVFFDQELTQKSKCVILTSLKKPSANAYLQIIKEAQQLTNLPATNVRLTQLLTDAKKKLFYDRISRPFFLIKIHEKVKDILDKYEKNCWTCTIEDKFFSKLSFRDLILKITESTSEIEKWQQEVSLIIGFEGIKDSPTPSTDEIAAIFREYSWELHFPKVFYKENDKEYSKRFYEDYRPPCKPLETVFIKTYINNMLTFADLGNQRTTIETIFNQFDNESLLAILLALKYQMLDLHPGNVGIISKLTEEQKYLRDMRFRINLNNEKKLSQETYSFEDIQRLYFDETIHKNTIISSSDNTQSECNNNGKLLCQIPHLLDAINCEKQAVLFDGDLSLGESNHYSIIINQKGKYTFYVPIKNPLLLIDTRHEVCPEGLLEALLQENSNVTSWIRRLDAPLWRRLSKENQERIDSILSSLLCLPQYNLSYHLKDGFNITKAKCAEFFAKDFANMQEQKFQEIFVIICDSIPWIKEKMNSFETALAELKNTKDIKRKLDSLQLNINSLQNTIAIQTNKRNALKKKNEESAQIQEVENHISVNQVKLEQVKNEIEKLQFLREQPLEKFNFLKKIGKQLFPRLTFNQYQALCERENNLKSYLELYEKIKNIQLENRAEFLQLVDLLMQHPVCTFLQKNTFNTALSSLQSRVLDNDEIYKSLYNFTRNMFVPTYFNIIKSMYPQVGNVYDLAQKLNSVIQHPDKRWFIHDDVFEMVANGLKTFPYGTDAYRLCEHLKREMDEHNTYIWINNSRR